MTQRWVLALVVAGGVCLVATPVAREIARASGLVDLPAGHKSHRRPTPYLGGVAITAAVLAGFLAGRGNGIPAVVLAAASVLTVLGLIDDHRSLDPWIRLGVEAVCAATVVACGVRFGSVADSAAVGLLSIMALVVVSNSVNLLDNVDGLAAGYEAVAVAGVLAAGALLGNTDVTVAAAAVLGACMAFLVFNGRHASIFMGDAGSLFLGFSLGGLAVALSVTEFSVGRGAAFVVLILGLALGDTASVAVARTLNGRSIMRGGRDHLSHRLMSYGLPATMSVAILLAVQSSLCVLAVGVAREWLMPWVALGVGGAVMGGLLLASARAEVYTEEISTPVTGHTSLDLANGEDVLSES